MENKRQIIHISMAAFALLLAFLTRWQALACAVAAFLFNWLAMPRIARGTLRPEEKQKGYSTGMLMYCVSVFLLILVFPARIAAGAWAVMAFGDGFASLIGVRFGKTKLGWNPNKSRAGFAAFIIAGTTGAFAFMFFINHYICIVHYEMPQLLSHPGELLALALLASVAAAFAESLDIKLNDNFTVPMAAGLTLWLGGMITATSLPWIPAHILPALAANAAMALLSYKLKAVDLSGAIGGFVIGVAIYYFGGYQAYAILLLFFIIGTACSKIGRKVKESQGIAQEKGGRRGLKNALANCLPGAAFIIVYGSVSHHAYSSTIYLAAVAYTACFAAVLADTVSSEIGQVFGKRPVLITTFKSVPAGANGGITLTGTLAGMAAATLLSLCAMWLGLFEFADLWLPITGAFIGMNLDSLLGATLENNGIIDNEFVNFCCGMSAGLACALVFNFLIYACSGPIDIFQLFSYCLPFN